MRAEIPRCGAARRSGGGGPCRQPAGFGTDHVGKGRCKFHGGASLRGKESPQWKHGAYSKYVELDELEDFAEWEDQGGVTGPELPFELRFALFKFETAIAKPGLSAETLSSLASRAVDIRLKIQKLLGQETPAAHLLTQVPIPIFAEDDPLKPDGGNG